MLKNYFKIALRNFLNQKFYSIINMMGLTIGLTCFILIYLSVQYEFSYESHHKNLENIYRVNVIQSHPTGEFASSHSMVPVGPALKEEMPEIAEFTRLLDARETLVKKDDIIFYEDNVFYTDPGIFNIFTIKSIYGNLTNSLVERNSAVITESIADKYFGSKNPVGEVLIIDNELNLTVTAVVEDFSGNTYINPDIMISFETIWKYDFAERFMNNWISTVLLTYVQIRKNSPITQIENKINSLYERYAVQEVDKKLDLEKFADIHLYSNVDGRGDIQTIYIFLIIGVLILLIAATNFMNLSTARSAKRANEIGLRKVIGANRLNLVKQFLGESLIYSFFSLLVAFLVVNIIMPTFSELTSQDLKIPDLSNLEFYFVFILISISLGLISGSYPAFYLARFKPISMLRGKTVTGSQSRLFRKTLVVLQFSIAIGLIICTLTINSQVDYLKNKKLGFRKEQMLILPVRGNDLDQEIEIFKQILSGNPVVHGVAGSWLLPTSIGAYNNVTWEGAAEGESIAIMQNKVGYDFLETYEMELVDGRNFSREFTADLADYGSENSGSLIINEEAVRVFGWENPIGKKIIQIFGDKRYYFNVIGVIKDFHFSSLKYKIKPVCLYLAPDNLNYVSIKYQQEKTKSVLAFVEEKWKQFNPGYPFDYFFLDQSYAKKYKSEEQINTLFSYFSFLAIFISCLGLLGLAAYSAEQRTTEIGVRKVLGADIRSIVVLLSKQFVKWILFANLIAWPIAWMYLDSWLSNFAYQTEINFTQFIIAGFAALIIGLGTVMYFSLKAAFANPVDSLKDE